MKALNLLLAAAMVSSTFVMPVSTQTASAAEKTDILYETSFDDVTALSDLTGDAGSKTGWGYYHTDTSGGTGDQYGLGSSKYIDLVDEDGNKYLYTYQTESQNGTENALYYDTSAVTSGSIVADYDIKFDLKNLVNMRIGYGKRADNMVTGDGEVYNGYWRSGSDKIQLAQAGAIEADKWYHVTMTADLDNDTMDIAIADRDTQQEIVNEQLTGLSDTKVTRVLGINTINISEGAGEKQGAYIDNVKISHITEIEEPDGGPAVLPFSEEFNYADINEMTAAGWSWRGEGDNISKIEDGVFKLGLQAGKDNYEAKRKFEPVTSGILTTEYDVTPAEGLIAYNYFWGTDSGKINALFFQTDNNIYFNGNPGSNVIGTYTPGQTYHCKVVIDIDNNTLDITVTDSTNQVVAQNSGTCGFDVKCIEELTFQTWSKPASDSWVAFDNLTMKHEEKLLEKLPINETFDYADMDEMKAAGWQAANAAADISKVEDGVFKLGLKAGEDNQQYIKSFEEVTSGIVSIEYDVTPTEGLCAYVWTGSARTPVFFFSEGNIRIGSTNDANAIIGTYTNGVTYHCVAELDLANNKLTAKVMQGEDLVAEGSKVGINSAVNQIVLQTWSKPASDSWVAFDNLTISNKSSEPGPVETPVPTAGPATLPYNEEFNYADIDEMEDAGWIFKIDKTNISKVEDGVFKLGLTPEDDNIRVQRQLVPITSGVITTEYDVTPASGIIAYNYFWGDNSGTIKALFFQTDNNIYFNGNPGSTVIGSYTPGQTYHCKIVIDIDNDTLDITVRDSNNQVVAAKSGACDFDVKCISELTFQTWSKPENDSWVAFDNLTMKHDEKAPEKLPINETFDYADIDAMKAAGWQAANADADISKVEDGVFKLGLKAGEDNQLFTRNFEEIVSGILHIEYDVTPTEGLCAYVWTGTNRTPVFFFSDGNIRIGSTTDTNAIIGTYTNGVTYHCSADLYLDNNMLTAKVTQGDETVAEGTRSGINSTVNQIAVQTWSKPENDSWVAFDNLSITHEEIIIELPPMNEPFDYNDINAMKAAGWTISSGYSDSKPGPNSEDSAIVGEGDDRAFYLGIDNNTDNIQAIKSFGSQIKQGKARMEFDIIPGADTLTYIWMSGTGEGANSGAWSASRFSLFVFNGGQVGIGGNDISRCKVLGNYTAGQKYHCSIIIDLETDTLTAEVKNENGRVIGSETLGYKGHSGTDMHTLAGLTLQEWGAATNTGSIFDNIVVSRLPEDAPIVSISNTTFVTDGSESHNYREVSTLTDSIEINFGAVMDPETIKGIKIVNSSDSSEAAYTSEVSGNVVKLNLTNTLAPNAEYTIVIPAEAANIDGTTLGEEARMVFNTVDDALFGGAIKALTAGGNAVTNISQIKSGTTLSADVKINNATAENKQAVVIFSFYDENSTLVKTNYEVIELNAGAKFNGTVDYTVEDMTDVKTVKVMLWDGFERIMALDGCTTIK